MTVLDGGTVNDTKLYHNLYISSGGVANNTIAQDGARLCVASGGTANNTTLNSLGFLEVYSGGIANDTEVSSGAFMEVHNSGIANNIHLRTSGTLYVYHGGTASIIFNPFEEGSIQGPEDSVVNFLPPNAKVYYGRWGNLISSADVMSGLTINYKEKAYVFSDGRLENTTIDAGGYVYLEEEGLANNTIVKSHGSMELYYADGANNIIISSGGYVYFNGCKLSGKITFESGANVSAGDHGIIDFDLTQTTIGAEELVNNVSIINGEPIYTLTVNGMQATGEYKLAGCASGFSKSITVKNTTGIELGVLSVGGTKIETVYSDYELKLNGDTLVITVTSKVLPDITPPTITNITSSNTAPTKSVTITATFADDTELASNTGLKMVHGRIMRVV